MAYRGWDLNAMQDAGENAAVQGEEYIPATTFTPINRPGAQLLTPPTAAPLQTNAVNGSTQQRSKQHNPVIAQYLGLGASREPSHLKKYAPVLPPTPVTPPKGRKRTRKAREDNSPSKKKKPRQRLVSDGLCVTKPVLTTSTNKFKGVTVGTKTGVGSFKEVAQHIADERKPSLDTQTNVDVTAKTPLDLSNAPSSVTLPRGSSTQATSSHDFPSSRTVSGTEGVEDIADNGTGATADEFDDDVFDCMDLDNAIDHLATAIEHDFQQNPLGVSGAEGNSHGDDRSATIFSDDDIFLSIPDLTDACSSSSRLDEDDPMLAADGSAIAATITSPHTSNVPGPSGKFVSPVTQKTEALVRKEKMNDSTDQKPIVRSQFPGPVRDRSPIIGMSSKTILRTCFRIGEAIQQASIATKHGKNIVFELYARVLSSGRDAIKQHFIFADLFHDRPPHLKGEYDATIWKEVELFNYDSGRFLTKAEMCRCIGTIKRNGNKDWVMTVLNIWEATWEDIEWVEGIVNA